MNSTGAETARFTAVWRQNAVTLARSQVVRDYCIAFERISQLSLEVVPTDEGKRASEPRLERGVPSLVVQIPVRMGPVTLAWLCLGPIRWNESVEQAALGNGVVARRVILEPSLRVRQIQAPSFTAWVRLAGIFARQLGERANALSIREAEARHPTVRRMREFIVLHVGEEILLRRAAAAGFSTCYFCKLFHRLAGMGFSEYLARVRVEVAKEMLLEPHTRINEAAFRAGFQSLSQFNRAFRRITGEAPSTYRHRLDAALGSGRLDGTAEAWKVAA